MKGKVESARLAPRIRSSEGTPDQRLFLLDSRRLLLGH